MNKLNVVIAGTAFYAYSFACCAVMPTGKPVRFGDQSNIVVWNPQTKMEHFVRNAYFESGAKDFGFIAPTPTKPTLSTADEEAYLELQKLAPPPKYRSKGGPAAGSATGAPRAQVIQRVNVGKYEATTLLSKDPKAIKEYLKQNGYTTNTDFDSWAAFYAKKGWMLTAFKVRQTKPGMPVQTGIVRMSFKTDKPFNPYYVPKNNSGNAHALLRILFISDGMYGARIGNGGFWSYEKWSVPLPASTAKTVVKSLKLTLSDLPANAKVTCFEKYGWLEGAKDDLYFQKVMP